HKGDFYRAPGAGAEQLDADFLADGCRGNSPLEVGWGRDGFAVKTDNHITGDNAGLIRGLSRHDFMHVHALRRLQPEGHGFGTVQGPNLHPQPTARHTTCSVQLRHDFLDRINGNGQPHFPTANNGRIHPDDFPTHVDQWTTAVACRQRGIGLEVASYQASTEKLTFLAAHNAQGNRVLETEGTANRHYQFTNVRSGRTTERHNRQGTLRGQLEQGHIAKWIASQDSRSRGLAIIQMYVNPRALLNHVIVGQYQAIRANDEATPGRDRHLVVWYGRMVLGQR